MRCHEAEEATVVVHHGKPRLACCYRLPGGQLLVGPGGDDRRGRGSMTAPTAAPPARRAVVRSSTSPTRWCRRRRPRPRRRSRRPAAQPGEQGVHGLVRAGDRHVEGRVRRGDARRPPRRTRGRGAGADVIGGHHRLTGPRRHGGRRPAGRQRRRPRRPVASRRTSAAGRHRAGHRPGPGRTATAACHGSTASTS